MTIKDLKELIADLPDDAPVVKRWEDDQDEYHLNDDPSMVAEHISLKRDTITEDMDYPDESDTEAMQEWKETYPDEQMALVIY